MKKRKSSRVSIRDIAKAAGISNAAAGFALQNRPKVGRATRERVLRIAKQLGYAPDPRLAVMMTSVRKARTKEFLPIAWLNAHSEEDAWQKYKFLSPYLEGARERGSQLGYRLEEIWLRQPGMTMKRISQILDQRGVEGVIATHHARHFRLNWDHLAGVALEHTVLAPRLHQVTTDFFSNYLLAIKMLRRAGYQRIGICLAESIDRRTSHAIRAMTHYLESTRPKSKQIPPFIYLGESDEAWRTTRQQMIAWLRCHQPDVIVGHDNRLERYVKEAGFRVPGDMGVVHLATDDDVSDWAGIFSNRKAIGAAALDWVVSLIQNRQFGVPDTALHTSVKGTWHLGRTLLIPKPK